MNALGMMKWATLDTNNIPARPSRDRRWPALSSGERATSAGSGAAGTGPPYGCGAARTTATRTVSIPSSAELGAPHGDERHHFPGVPTQIVDEGQLAIGLDLTFGGGFAPELQPGFEVHAKARRPD